MHILITAGNTQVPIDHVRCITNVFTGRTGTEIARTAVQRGHQTVLLTSHPELIASTANLDVLSYRTFDDLRRLLEKCVRDRPDAVIHCAAVSDYEVQGVYQQSAISGQQSALPESAGKIKSHHPELWLRLTPTPKLVDLVRSEWEYDGILVKFKLEAGVSEKDLTDIAEKSRQQSRADLMVANTLEEKDAWALLGPINGSYERLARHELATRLVTEVESLVREG